MSRDKGARFEREIAGRLKDEGYNTRRGSSFIGESDVVGLPDVHLELKAREQMRLYDWMEQSKRDAGEQEKPIVIHKQNYKEILVTMRFDDWIEFYREWEAGIESQRII